MSNFVKISALGNRDYIVDEHLTPQAIVEKMGEHLQEKLSQVLPEKPDLILFPEYCDIPANFINSPAKTLEYCQIRGDQILDLMSGIARNHLCYIAYSTFRIQHDLTLLNSIVILDRTGKVIGEYNKNFLTLGEIEDYGAVCGKEAPIIECDFGRIACAVCFDLNFDQLRLKYVEQKPDVILFSSNFHGALMQNYWAYSCRSHFVGAIGGGQPSAIISPVGSILESSTNYFDYVTTTVNLDCAVVHLDFNQKKLAAIKAKYGTKIKMTDPGYLGSVLISCETEEYKIRDIIEEFDVELLDDYLTRLSSYH
ncbi:carbon-nitrogen hydrolase family protein [Paenibacillus agaridevorans]|uniref:carbon-nitrogen hydrolase family protein n=1 Tax=Paenibacillus agaridevorans TaxID=171404 RepID=UPI001BE42A00|nr:carbon-nitrogen hydrolase family protein [Paenibacillus agaridevorans]